MDCGPEFFAEVMNKWGYERNIEMNFFSYGKPHQNEYMEGFNYTFWEETLDVYQLERLKKAQLMAAALN